MGVVILPHGDFAFDPSIIDYKNHSLELHTACKHVGKLVHQDWKPDIILLSTPHGISLSNMYALYDNSQYQGYVEIGNDLPVQNQTNKYKAYLNLTGDTQITEELETYLQQNGFQDKATVIQSFQDSDYMSIRWGEVIPTSFIVNQTSSKNKEQDMPKFLILSQPLRRFKEPTKMVPDLLDLGSILANFFESSEKYQNKKVAILISGDLAHTHLASGPYGYSNAAQPFDDALRNWVSYKNRDYLLKDATQLVDDAKSCGFTGFVMAQGILDKIGIDNWSNKMYINEHPTYYGMMVGVFTRLG